MPDDEGSVAATLVVLSTGVVPSSLGYPNSFSVSTRTPEPGDSTFKFDTLISNFRLNSFEKLPCNCLPIAPNTHHAVPIYQESRLEVQEGARAIGTQDAGSVAQNDRP